MTPGTQGCITGSSLRENYLMMNYLLMSTSDDELVESKQSSLRANNKFFNNILNHGGVSPLTLVVSNDLIC